VSSSITNKLLARLSRVTSSGAFLPEIDGLRFFAIAVVILHHINTLLERDSPINFVSPFHDGVLYQFYLRGAFGVNLFFVISGFILSLPFAAQHLVNGAKKVSLRAYYLRRVTRLEPPYLICIVIYFILKTTLVHLYGVYELLPHLGASAIYIHNILYGGINPISVVIWSLEVEVQFYILAPFIGSIYAISNRIMRWATFLLVMLVIPLLSRYAGVRVTDLNIIGNLSYFMMGFFLSDLYIVSWRQRPQRTYWWDFIGTMAWMTMTYALYTWRIAKTLPFLILIAYIGAFRGKIWNAIVRNRWLATCGGMCYTVYLFHGLILQFFNKLTLNMSVTHYYTPNLLLQTLILFPVTFICAAPIFLFIEKPFMYREWPARVWEKIREFLKQAKKWPRRCWNILKPPQKYPL
jgi:peptidoglycan/LPS O-acetylase OafA/YrhL